MKVTVHGYEYSVYTWIVCATLAEKGVPYAYSEINPFDVNPESSYLSIHPFQKVPALVHDDWTVYETTAISRYIDTAFSGPSLQPKVIANLARMTQIISIVDSYGYWPMVRQVFSNRVFLPKEGNAGDEMAIVHGLSASHRVLETLNEFVGNQEFMCGDAISLADLHLAPMIDYFQQAEEGNRMLSEFDALSRWWSNIKLRDSLVKTQPKLSEIQCL